MTIKELRDFIFENCHKRVEFPKDNSSYLMKRQKEKKSKLSKATRKAEKV